MKFCFRYKYTCTYLLVMVVLNYMNIDKYLTKYDFQNFIQQKLVWPWKKTHFKLSSMCYGCREPTYLIPEVPNHFIMDSIIIQNAQVLLESSFFWCPFCSIFTIYEHYIEEECSYCHANILIDTMVGNFIA